MIVCRFSHSSAVHFHLASYVCLRTTRDRVVAPFSQIKSESVAVRGPIECWQSQLSYANVIYCLLIDGRWQPLEFNYTVRTYLIFASCLEQRKSVHERIALCVAVLVISLVNLVKVIEPIVVTEHSNECACTLVN